VDDEVIIPKGEFVIRENDVIYVIGRPHDVFDFCTKVGLYTEKVRNVMIAGGGRLAYYLARQLEDTGVKAKIIESDKRNALSFPSCFLAH
jgi:trk system potassium uptake protein TrkA